MYFPAVYKMFSETFQFQFTSCVQEETDFKWKRTLLTSQQKKKKINAAIPPFWNSGWNVNKKWTASQLFFSIFSIIYESLF